MGDIEILDGDCGAPPEVRASHVKALRELQAEVALQRKDNADIFDSLREITETLKVIPALNARLEELCRMVNEIRDERKDLAEWRREMDIAVHKNTSDITHAWEWIHEHERQVAAWDIAGVRKMALDAQIWCAGHDKRIEESRKDYMRMIVAPLIAGGVGVLLLMVGLGGSFLIYKTVADMRDRLTSRQEEVHDNAGATPPNPE